MIYICTTAINRPDLHSQVFINNKHFFTNSEYEYTWIINIDFIDYLPYSYEETKNNYIQLIDDYNINSNIIICDKSDNSSFMKAAKKIASVCSKTFQQGDFLLWLEDDWLIENKKYHIDQIMNHMNEYTVFNLYCKCKISNLYPMIRGYKMASLLLTIFSQMPETSRDPEISLKGRHPVRHFDVFVIQKNIDNPIVISTLKTTLKNFSNVKHITEKEFSNFDMTKVNNLTMFVFNNPFFIDVGRNYMKTNQITKTNKQEFYKKINN